ncbi:MAG: hypothetical protein GY849_04570 [Deltaproteobacteria bacterium]|nr:hypothetical protein [Deltaproteobacteria bacterium]
MARKREWLFRKSFILFLIFPFFTGAASALETGDAYLGIFGGYQEGVFSQEGYEKHLGLTTSIYQPTLNLGDYHLDFIGFYRNDLDNRIDQFELGFLGARVKDLWLFPNYEMDAFLGDGYMQFITPSLIFEHFALPGQSLRGLGTEVRAGWGRAGLQAGRFTQGDFLVPGAVTTVDGGLAGAYFEWEGAGEARLSAAIDVIRENEEDRRLSTLYGRYPLGESAELRMAGWHDSLSDNMAAIAGIRSVTPGRYGEGGLLYIPESFNYVNSTASLPGGKTLLFGTYRFSGVRYGYHLEGSGGKLDASGIRSRLGRGSLGGYYRIFLRDTISSGLHFSYRDSDSGRRQTKLQENIRYTRRRRKWDTSLQVQAMQLFDVSSGPESRSHKKDLRWIGELRSHYRSGAWDAGGKIGLEQEYRSDGGDRTSAILRLEGRTSIGYGVTGGGFLQYSMGWGEDTRSNAYGGGLDITFPLPGGWQLRTRLRAQRNDFSYSETEASLNRGLDTVDTTIDLFAIIEKRFFWGRPAPVIGKFGGPKPKGVGHIKGRVFVDQNQNGIFDAGDKPLGGVMLRLDQGFVIETNAHGLYRFPNIAGGEHHLNLDPASFPIDYVSPRPEGMTLMIYPRDEIHRDWPLKLF